MTIILAIVNAYGTNKDFQPVVLYIGTFLIDLAIVEAML